MATYLVTGGAGFIGSHLVERLARDGEHVRVLDNLSSGRIENLRGVRGHCDFIEGDAADAHTVARAMQGVAGVFHLAAISSVGISLREPLRNQQAGEVATLTVLDTARHAGVRRVVFSSSAAVYGNSLASKNDESLCPQPLTFYGLSKLAGENYCRIASALHPELDTVGLRYFNVFGPRQDPSNPYSGVISIFLRCLREGSQPTIFGDGLQTRDFTDVSNVVEANLLAMKSRADLRGECFNVGTGESVSIREVWEHLCQLSGTHIEPHFAPARTGDIRHSCAAIGKIEHTLGFLPRVGWRSGLKRLWTALDLAAEAA